jgi:hypothetical protein
MEKRCNRKTDVIGGDIDARSLAEAGGGDAGVRERSAFRRAAGGARREADEGDIG